MKMIIKTPDFLQAEFFMRDEKINFSDLPLIAPLQVHADKILIIDDSNINQFSTPGHPEADGIFLRTSKAEASLRFADCTPVLIFGENSAMILHSGYKGTVLKIAAKGVKLFNDFGEKSENLHAWIGPCIGQAHYARNLFNDEWTLKGKEIFHAENFIENENEKKIYFDLAGEIKTQLKESGLDEKNINLSGIDTFENLDCYSYRRGDKIERMTLKIKLLS